VASGREQGAPAERAPARAVPGRLVVVVVLVGAALTAGVITWAAFANRADKRMEAPAVGAGAGHTGMYNEYGGIGK
jgi:hypothetical protein